MNTLPNFHDGFFDGLHITGPKEVRLFLRTRDQGLFTLVLRGVQAMKFGNVRCGNIILDAILTKTEDLTEANIEEVYEIPAGQGRQGQLSKLLSSARESGLIGFELSSSYGAEGVALLQTVEIRSGHEPH